MKIVFLFLKAFKLASERKKNKNKMTSISEEAKSAIGLFNTIYTSTDTELISHTIK